MPVPALKPFAHRASRVAVVVSSILLAACGGDEVAPTPGGGAGVCSVQGQKELLLDYMYEDYFWADDLPADIDVADYPDVYAMLANIRVPEDRYSFLLSEAEYQARFVDASFAGFGFSSAITDDNRVFMRYVYNDSPAAQAGLQRADELISVAGEPVSTLIAENRLNEALGPSTVGTTVALEWRSPNGTTQSAQVTKDNVETNTVFAPTVYSVDDRMVGYFVLDSFIERTGEDLNEAYDIMAAANVDDLIIDVRYNGGGLINYANQLASQAAGNNVLGNVFVTYNFNSNNQNRNQTSLFNLVDGVQQLDLDRVFVLTTGASCSSSEILINSLRPFVEVVAIGETTCGKPVGQSVTQLCDKRTFVVNFETVNALGQGRYYFGLAPNCPVQDAIVADWGNPLDPLQGAANEYISTGSCPASGSAVAGLAEKQQPAEQADTLSDSQTKRPPLLIEKWRTEY
ncbi:C-terminal peptidase (prc) [Pseudidiomarina planktonica]|uniref:C-terminal peptidase (Prc) n=1 Tax=Pseudidiomarina planktonica TaxID=1323738 RepID=A0A1Y6EMZ7_9GAMM|nr:S41 family peptidase [Pseudidiomarina planktonica]RUO65621.1 peptidase S41 [Pseudidiomarina planktonica]SMQ64034.1 C-terminal peptidase (prc) [Pseudidiomarina planktonica]